MLQVANVRAAGLTILQGMVAVGVKGTPADSTGTSLVGSLSITAGAQLDVMNNVLIVQPLAASKATALALLQSELASHEVLSSALPAGTVLALVDNGSFVTPYSSFAGQNVDSNSLIVAALLPGDANADGTVDLSDLSAVLSHFGGTNANWTAGNFDGSSTIDLTDLADVLNNFGMSSPSGAVGSASSSAAPEPASLLVLALGAFCLSRRRSLLTK
jgi:hypothetical protein